MLNIFKKQIMDCMGWNKDQFSIFEDRYKTAYNIHRKNQKPFIYTIEYLDCILSLFYVYKHKIKDQKSFLIALLLNGLISDISNLYPSKEQIIFLEDFFDERDEDIHELIDPITITNIKFLCNNSLNTELTIYSDYIDYNDYMLFNDFRLFFRAIKIPERNIAVVYHMNPNKIVWRSSYKEGIFIHEELLQELFKMKHQIKDENLHDLFSYKISSYIKAITKNTRVN